MNSENHSPEGATKSAEQSEGDLTPSKFDQIADDPAQRKGETK